MKTQTEIENLLAEIKSDERLGYPPALIQINAPLALIQVELKTKVRILEWVLKS